MHAVGGVVGVEGAVGAVCHGCVIIDIGDRIVFGVDPYAAVEFGDSPGCVGNRGIPIESGCRQGGGKNHFYACRAGELAHGYDVAHGAVGIVGVGVFGAVVGGGVEHYEFGVQVYHVVAETGEELVGALAGYATADEMVVGEERWVVARPEIGDGIAHEHYATLRKRQGGHAGVVGCVTFEVPPVFALCGRSAPGSRRYGCQEHCGCKNGKMSHLLK